MKDRFTTEEWELVTCVPIQAFGVVAGADQQVEQKEFEEFSGRMVRGALGYKDPLHRELAQDLISSDIPKLIQRSTEADIGETKALLRSKLTPDEYQSFLGSVFIDSLAVARASGMPGAEISDKEQTMLAAFGLAWEIDLEALQRLFS
ncbi:MAG: hypothetical protein ACXWXS_11165 [Actinomycetota bacterium]